MTVGRAALVTLLNRVSELVDGFETPFGLEWTKKTIFTQSNRKSVNNTWKRQLDLDRCLWLRTTLSAFTTYLEDKLSKKF